MGIAFKKTISWGVGRRECFGDGGDQAFSVTIERRSLKIGRSINAGRSKQFHEDAVFGLTRLRRFRESDRIN